MTANRAARRREAQREAVAIVEALAACNPRMFITDDDGVPLMVRCVVCDNAGLPDVTHRGTCPYALAQAFVEKRRSP